MINKTAEVKFGFRPCSHGTGQIYACVHTRRMKPDEFGQSEPDEFSTQKKLGFPFYGIGFKF